MYLSYSGHKSYKSCAKQYWHRYIDKTVTPKPDNRVNSLYGSIVGTLFEHFYADKIWLQKGVEEILLSMAHPTAQQVIARESKGGVINYKEKAANYKSYEALLADVIESIPRGLSIIRHHRLLGVDAAAEVKLDSTIQNHRIGGRADFVMTRARPHKDHVILDGKGSKHRDKYVDPEQLKWYAMLWREKFDTVPDGLAFLYWRYEPAESMDWVPFTRDDLDRLRAEVVESADRIDSATLQMSIADPATQKALRQELLPAKPSSDCTLCSYLEICPEGTTYKNAKVPSSWVDSFGVDGEDVGL